jgi:hypothetical protein
MLLGHNKHVGGSLWTNVMEGVGAIIFINFPGRNVALDHAAEDTTRFEVGHRNSFKFRVSTCKRESRNGNSANPDLVLVAASVTAHLKPEA